MAKPPKSYLKCKRPPLMEALRLEGSHRTVGEAMGILLHKGYFTPAPRPWKLGSSDRGLGRVVWAILDRFGNVVVKVEDRGTAELIISAVNTCSTVAKKRK